MPAKRIQGFVSSTESVERNERRSNSAREIPNRRASCFAAL
ncbi:MAG: hypothetical protein OXI88_21500 [Gammaproteobacteria bacterium]|nr:hypothetical protein [Gammaproteobacteria bacterium]